MNLLIELWSFAGTYKDGLAPDGKILSDHMLLGSVVATILIIDNTSQVSTILISIFSYKCSYLF